MSASGWNKVITLLTNAKRLKDEEIGLSEASMVNGKPRSIQDCEIHIDLLGKAVQNYEEAVKEMEIINNSEQKQSTKKEIDDFRQILVDLSKRKTDFVAAIGVEYEKQNDIDASKDWFLKAAENYLKLGMKSDAEALITHIEVLSGKREPNNFLSSSSSGTSSSTSDPFADVPMVPTGPITPSAPQLPEVDAPITSNEDSSNSSSKFDFGHGEGLSPSEIQVLKDSSRINGKLFYPWLDGEENGEKFNYSLGPWEDPDGLLPLSAKQQSRLGAWKRPEEMFPGSKYANNDKEKLMVVKEISPYSIEQDLVGDCSFIASLCICAAYERRYNKRLITNIIFPQDRRGNPVYNPSGKYMVKLWANGVARKILVDDRFPVSRSNKFICSSCRDPRELWVTIIEKAYMKLNGGYNFPGSNSGIDLYSLTGWIPEHIVFEENRKQSTSQRRGSDPTLTAHQTAERAWERLLSAYHHGDCLITCSTTNIDQTEADSLGLVPSHAYAVLRVAEVSGKRFMLLKNPWATKRWLGTYSEIDTQSWTPELRKALSYDPERAANKDDGIFWIDWPNIRKYFGTIFLNWNPNLFLFRHDLHDVWPVERGPANDSYTVMHNPQYLIQPIDTTKAKGTKAKIDTGITWVLLTRHVVNKDLEEGENCDFLTLHCYNRNGKNIDNGGGTSSNNRVFLTDEDAVYRGIYSNNPHTLVRLDDDVFAKTILNPSSSTTLSGNPINPYNNNGENLISHPFASSGALTLVLSQLKKTRNVRFTITIFSTKPVHCQPIPTLNQQFPYSMTMKGTWNALSAGGKVGTSRFVMNPMYSLAIPSRVPKGKTNRNGKLPVLFTLLATKEICGQISIIGGPKGGRRIDFLYQTDERSTSGKYRYGFSYLEFIEGLDLGGHYTVILSTFHDDKRGNFLLEVHAPCNLSHVKVIPTEGQGNNEHTQFLHGQWLLSDNTSGGRGENYLKNPIYALDVKGGGILVNIRLVLIHAHLQKANTDISKTHFANLNCGGEAINVTIFKPSINSKSKSQTVSLAEHTVDKETNSCLPDDTNISSSNVIISSKNGHYVDGKCGTSTDYVALEEGTYFVIPSCYEEGLASAYHMYIYTITTNADQLIKIRKIFPK